MRAGRALPGTSYNSRAAKWQARIAVNGTRLHLGYFDTPELAHAAYAEAKRGAKPQRRARAARAPAIGANDLAALVTRAMAGMVIDVLDRMEAAGGTLTLAQALRDVAAQASVADLI